MTKSRVIFGVGVLMAVLAGILSYGILQVNAKTQREAAQTQSVVVAAANLKWGTTITAENVKTALFLKRTLASGYFPNTAGIVGRTLIYPVRANEPIFESQLAPRTADAGGIAALLEPSKRAMAVKVDKVIGVSGFIHTGNRVDVLATFNRMGADPTPATKTVIENVLVLATGPEMEKAGKVERQAPVDVITLEVSTDEAEKLALAATEGKLTLALRNQADSAEVVTKGTTVAQLMSSVSSQGPTPERHVAPDIRRVARPTARVSAAVEHGEPAFEVQQIRGGVVGPSAYLKGE